MDDHRTVPSDEMARWPGMEGQAQEGPFAWLREVALGLSIREPLKDALTRILARCRHPGGNHGGHAPRP